MNFGDLTYGHHPMVDYFNAMEPESYGIQPANKPDVTLGVQDIGMSVPMGISAANVAGIYSKIRMGAGKLEIQFPGYKIGNRNQQTPEMLGQDQRQALREMQMANEVRFSTHASFGLMGMMGRNERGDFSTDGAYQDMLELNRAIDFQADMGGGSVVMHSGEFERPITDMHLDDETHHLNLARDASGRLLVRQSQVQEYEAKFDILDARTSQKMETVQKDRLAAYPVWNRAEKDYNGVDLDGNPVLIKKGDYIDYQNRLIPNPYDPVRGRVPKHDPETGRFKVELRHFDYFKQEADEYNEWFKKTHGREPNFYEKAYPEEKFIAATLEAQAGHSRGWALEFGVQTETWIKALKAIDKAEEFYKKLDESIPEEEKWKIMKQELNLPLGGAIQGLIPPETKHPLEVLRDARTEAKSRLEFARQSSAAQEQQAEDTVETIRNLITPIKRLEQHGVRMYAESAMHAMQRTKDPNNPVVVTIENLFPERFGGHLEELKWVIKKSRERMVELLTSPKIQYGVSRKPTEMTREKLEQISPGKEGMLQENPYYMGVSKQEAEKIAERHIKATLDTGHLNMWRKFWQDDPKLNREQNDAKFKEWYLQQVESLAKEKMIGNVHLADNFGYQDDHLSPGQGNAPIKEVVSILKKYGYDRALTVEPGADATTDLSDFHGLMKTWRHFGSPMYGMGMGSPQIPQNWTDVQYSYFGQNRPPYFVFGPYAPSNDWTLWSAVPME
jgi:hypothetical protein